MPSDVPRAQGRIKVTQTASGTGRKPGQQETLIGLGLNRIRRSQAVYQAWTDWYREVIWYGNKKGAYLYGNEAAEPELAGHY